MMRRPLGNTGLAVSPIGLGTVKLGRTRKLRYAEPFALPTEDEAAALLQGAVEAGVNLIDTAPAYGLAEERIGRHLAHRRDELVLTTKAGERFDDRGGTSTFDFTAAGITVSVERSLRVLRTDHVDAVLIHSDGDDAEAANDDAVAALQELRRRGVTRCIGLSGKTLAGATAALAWADVLMVEFHAEDESHRVVMREAKRRGVGVLVKKGLASGRLDAAAAVRWLMAEPAVDVAVIGTRTLEHLRANLRTAADALTTMPEDVGRAG